MNFTVPIFDVRMRPEPALFRLFENAVFLELKRRLPQNYEIHYWKDRRGAETDFVIRKGMRVEELVQVVVETSDKVRKREVRGLVSCARELGAGEGTIVTKDVEGSETVGGGKNTLRSPMEVAAWGELMPSRWPRTPTPLLGGGRRMYEISRRVADRGHSLIILGIIVGMGDMVGMTTKIDERGRATIPQEIRKSLRLKPGQELVVERRAGGIILRPQMNEMEFIKELEGCITEANQVSKLSPMKLKEIWGAGHAHG